MCLLHCRMIWLIVDFVLVSALRYMCVYLGCSFDGCMIRFAWNVYLMSSIIEGYLRVLAHFDVVIVMQIDDLCGE